MSTPNGTPGRPFRRVAVALAATVALAAGAAPAGCGGRVDGALGADDPAGLPDAIDAAPDAATDDGLRDLAADALDDARDASADAGIPDPGPFPDAAVDGSSDTDPGRAGDDADVPPDLPPGPLAIESVQPDHGGASVGTPVAIRGQGFVPGMTAFLGGAAISDLAVVSRTEATATFGPVALVDRGAKDLRVVRDDGDATLVGAFAFEFDQDPIVFVHGFMGGGEKDFGTMVQRFRDLGYPDGFLNAITYGDDTGRNIPQARDELAPYVDEVLARTGADKVDLVAHSMGGLSSRLYIREFGGKDKVRDYVSTCGAHHGTEGACATLWWAGAQEMCPAYAGRGNEVQWTLNGDPDADDVDETPYGIEDGGAIHWHAIHSDGDLIILPYTGSCLNQKSRNDCSDPINVRVSGIGHNDVPKNEGVFRIVAGFLMEHTPANP